MALHCTECGFLNDEGANYCQRCGALLPHADSPGGTGAGGDPVTATYRIDETGELVPVEMGEVTAHGPALVIRAGGGRVGESFAIDGERMSIGRRPECEVLLFTGIETDDLMRQAFAGGAKSFILKSDARSHLLEAIRALAQHKPYFTNKVSAVIFARLLQRRGADEADPGEGKGVFCALI